MCSFLNDFDDCDKPFEGILNRAKKEANNNKDLTTKKADPSNAFCSKHDLHLLCFNFFRICIFCTFVYEHTMLRSSIPTRTLNSFVPF